MPTLTIIAGPNGAGKSTLSKDFLSDSNIEAFDFDKEFYSTWSKFSFDPAIEQGAFDHTSNLYLERKAIALRDQTDFAFETNYHDENVLSVFEEFKKKGFRTELIFLCLESKELAIARVKYRVAKGGHFVDEETIRQRFDAGLKLLNSTFDKFDLVTVYISQQNSLSIMRLIETETTTSIVLSAIPLSIEPHLERLIAYPPN